jgi:hypothetical protein
VEFRCEVSSNDAKERMRACQIWRGKCGDDWQKFGLEEASELHAATPGSPHPKFFPISYLFSIRFLHRALSSLSMYII